MNLQKIQAGNKFKGRSGTIYKILGYDSINGIIKSEVILGMGLQRIGEKTTFSLKVFQFFTSPVESLNSHNHPLTNIFK